MSYELQRLRSDLEWTERHLRSARAGEREWITMAKINRMHEGRLRECQAKIAKLEEKRAELQTKLIRAQAKDAEKKGVFGDPAKWVPAAMVGAYVASKLAEPKQEPSTLRSSPGAPSLEGVVIGLGVLVGILLLVGYGIYSALAWVWGAITG